MYNYIRMPPNQLIHFQVSSMKVKEDLEMRLEHLIVQIVYLKDYESFNAEASLQLFFIDSQLLHYFCLVNFTLIIIDFIIIGVMINSMCFIKLIITVIEVNFMFIVITMVIQVVFFENALFMVFSFTLKMKVLLMVEDLLLFLLQQ